MDAEDKKQNQLSPSLQITGALTPDQLAEAFHLFAQSSARLEEAYLELQGRVQQLTDQLAVANGELRREYEAKEALSSRLALLLDVLPGGVLVLDANERILEMNPAAQSILGMPQSGALWQDVSAELAKTDAPHEYRLNRADQERRIVLHASKIESSGETVLLLNDVTDAEQLKQQLEHHKKLAAMGEMAASLAHQLRTPIATALLYSSHLERQDLPGAERERFARRVQERLHHLERMVQDMLSFVRGRPGARESISAMDILAELNHIVQPLMADKQIEYQVSTLGRDAVVQVDRKAFIGALVNVLENAMQFCGKPGKIELVVQRCADSICWSVKDNGAGLADGVMNRLFEPFVTTRSEGTGLGLAIVRNVATSHGGSVSAANAPEGGARVEVCLPLGEALRVKI